MDGNSSVEYTMSLDGSVRDCQYTNYDISAYIDNQAWRFGNYDVAKPNIMRSEIDLVRKGEKAIFPYENGAVIPEKKMQSEYPYTYGFLKEYKDKLNSRDKGKTDNYPAWYAYGRTQGMNNVGLKVLVPYMADRGVAIISEKEDLLFYCGYAVFAKDERTLLLLKYFIESDVFWFYIRMLSDTLKRPHRFRVQHVFSRKAF